MDRGYYPSGWRRRSHVIPLKAHLARIRRKISMTVLYEPMALDHLKRSLHRPRLAMPQG